MLFWSLLMFWGSLLLLMAIQTWLLCWAMDRMHREVRLVQDLLLEVLRESQSRECHHR